MSTPTTLAGQTALVTGGARGIGLAIAQRLSREGCRVVIWDREFTGFNTAAAGFTPFLQQQVDVSSLQSVRDGFSELMAAAGSVDIVVNNAGINGPIAPTWEYPIDAWQRVIDIDLTGVFYVCRSVIPQMRELGHGRLINVASISGKEGNANSGAYAAAKAGVIAYSKSIAKELADSGVLVNCIAPTIAETDLMKEMTPDFISTIKAKIPMGRFVKVEEVAAMVAWIAGPECSFTTGFVFDLTGGRATY